MPATNAIPIKSSIALSVAVHVVLLVSISIQMHKSLKNVEPQIMRVQLVNAPQSTKKPVSVKKVNAPKPKPIKTQASAAPSKPVKKIIKQNPSKAPTKLVDTSTPKPIQKKTEIAKKRPPVLDRTPEKKKVIKSEDPNAKTVATPPDDFLAALDAIDDLKLDAEKAEKEQPIDADVSENVELSHSDQNLIGKIKEHIEEFWVRPPGLRVEDLSAVLELRMNSDGTVQSMKVTQSSGQTFYDNSIKRAVRKAQPLPIPIGKYEIFKVLELYFKG